MAPLVWLRDHPGAVTAAVVTFFALVVVRAVSQWWQSRPRRRDRRRLFTADDKQVLLRQAGFRCEHQPVWGRRCQTTSGLQADHIVPWSKGGRTVLSNGQVLCARHNSGKSDLVPGVFYQWRLARLRRRWARHRTPVPPAARPLISGRGHTRR